MGNILIPGKNTATVTREDADANAEKAQAAKMRIRQAGELVAPFGLNYMGSAVVHYYSRPTLDPNNPVFIVVSQTNLAEVPEGFADQGFKQLKETVMNTYGRHAPRKSKDGKK